MSVLPSRNRGKAGMGSSGVVNSSPMAWDFCAELSSKEKSHTATVPMPQISCQNGLLGSGLVPITKGDFSPDRKVPSVIETFSHVQPLLLINQGANTGPWKHIRLTLKY